MKEVLKASFEAFFHAREGLEAAFLGMNGLSASQ